jgi:hypothetical protein
VGPVIDRNSEIQELSASDMDEVSGASYAVVKIFLDGVQAALDKLRPEGTNDLRQKLQSQLNESNSI